MSEPYFGWALDAVKSLHWLVHVDDWAFSGTRENLGGRDPRVIDIAHVRWATSAAITALDLCAAEIAVRSGIHKFWSEPAPDLRNVRREFRKQKRANGRGLALKG